MISNLNNIFKELNFETPIDLSFGTSTIGKINQLDKSYGKKCLIITGPNLIKTNI